MVRFGFGDAVGMKMPGWHMHFVSEECTTGGHVLSYAVGDAVAQLDDITDSKWHCLLRWISTVERRSTNRRSDISRPRISPSARRPLRIHSRNVSALLPSPQRRLAAFCW